MAAAASGVALAGASVLGGCSASQEAVDCGWRIAYDDVTYRSHNELVDPPPAAEPVGTGDALDCEREPDHRVEVEAVDGVDPRVAIVVAINPGEPPSLYVREGVGPDEWPAAIRRTEQ